MTLSRIRVVCPRCDHPFRTHDGGDVTFCPRCKFEFGKHEHRR